MRKRFFLNCLLILTLVIVMSTNAFALSESDVESAVSSSGKEAVSGTVLVWFLCAIAFLKVSQKIDSFLSLGMAVAFLLPILLPFAWFKPVIPYLDQIITITLSVIMLPAPIRTIITAFRDLMLIPPEEDTIEEIKNLVEPIIRTYGYQKLYYDILRTGRKLWISVYITFEKDLVSLAKFKAIQSECIAALAEEYPDFYFELLPDIAFTGAEKAALEQKILEEQMQEMQEGTREV